MSTVPLDVLVIYDLPWTTVYGTELFGLSYKWLALPGMYRMGITAPDPVWVLDVKFWFDTSINITLSICYISSK